MDTRFAFEVICALTVQVTILIATTFALQRWVNDSRTGSRLWTACFVCVIGLIAAGLLLPHRRLFGFPSGMSRETLVNYVQWQHGIALTLVTVWLAGVIAIFVRKVSICLRLTRFLNQHCMNIDAEDVLRRVDIRSVDWSHSSKLRLAVSPHIQGPFCWQFHAPVIVLPEFLLNGDETTLRHVLLHELEHLRTKHPMQHFLQSVCATIFWFHPMVALAARRAELNREFLCDELAAKTIGKFSAYLRTLATVAEHSRNLVGCRSVGCSSPSGTLAFGNQESALILRCKRLVQVSNQKAKTTRSRAWISGPSAGWPWALPEYAR
ncbi:MAG: M56 family metallopeptidase, partial [Planctomycetota bacterium]